MPVAVKTTNVLIEELLKGLDPRQKKVLIKRYGLDTGEALTLAELGKVFGVTRERIRQIESIALKEAKRKAKEGHVDPLIKSVIEKLECTGGVCKDDHLLEHLKDFSHQKEFGKNFAAHVRFLLELTDSVLYHKADDELHGHWHLSKEHQKRALSFLDSLVKYLKDKRGETLDKKKFDAFFKEVVRLQKVEEEAASQYVAISKKFGKNKFGDIGLTEWEEVSPKVARHWIYLVLKKAKKPMHFTEIAEAIRKTREGKKTNTQTIHNELIKDKRFILVGRGVYGLREMDNLPAGTIREILIHILKKEGPMKPKQIVQTVLKHRIFKENTILFNLQNKKFFKRLDNGTYAVR